MKDLTKDQRTQRARALANHVKGRLDLGDGFILILFPLGETALPTDIDYISNGDRNGCIDVVRGLLERLEGRGHTDEASPKKVH